MPGSYNAEHQVGLDIRVTERQALCCPLYSKEGKQQQPQVDQKLKSSSWPLSLPIRVFTSTRVLVLFLSGQCQPVL